MPNIYIYIYMLLNDYRRFPTTDKHAHAHLPILLSIWKFPAFVNCSLYHNSTPPNNRVFTFSQISKLSLWCHAWKCCNYYLWQCMWVEGHLKQLRYSHNISISSYTFSLCREFLVMLNWFTTQQCWRVTGDCVYNMYFKTSLQTVHYGLLNIL